MHTICNSFQTKTLTQICEWICEDKEREILQIRPTFNMVVISATMEGEKCNNKRWGM